MNLKFFILGLCVLVTIAQSSAQQHLQEGPEDDEEEGDVNENVPREQEEDDDDIEQRRKIQSIMNSAVNIIEPEGRHVQEVYTEVKNTPSNYMAPMQPAGPPPSPGGGLLGSLIDMGSNLVPLLKPLGSLLKNIFPLLGPLLNGIVKAIPFLTNLFKMLQPLLGLLGKVFSFLKSAFKCLKTLFKFLLDGFKTLFNALKTLFNLLPVLPDFLAMIPKLVEGLWRIWRSLRYAILYPIRTLKRWLQRIVRVLYGVPRYLGAILRGIGHLLISPVRILGFLFKRGFLVFNDYVIIPVARLKYFLINLFDVLLGPLNIVRHFLEELACLFVKTPLRVARSIMRAIFVNGILNTIRYIKTVIFEIIRFPWSRHYASMFPSLGNRHNYVLPKQLCQGNVC